MQFPYDLTVRPHTLPLPFPRPSGMQIYYPLDRSTIVHSKQKDIVGDKQGTVSATLTKGKIDTGLQFNGSTQYFDLNHSPDIGASEELTIAFWTKGAAGSTNVILGVGNVFPSTAWNRVQFNWSTPNIRLYVKDDAGNIRQYTTTATLLNNAWHSIVGIISPKDDKTAVYVDGVYDGGAAGALGAITLDGWTYHAGCLNNDGTKGSYAAGYIDEIMFVNREWSSQQAKAFHESRLLG